MPRLSRSFAPPLLASLALALGSAVLSSSLVMPSADVPSVATHIVRTGIITGDDRSHVIEQHFKVPPRIRQIDIDFSHAPVGPDAFSQFDLGLRSPDGLRGWTEDYKKPIHLDAVSA